MLALLGSNEYHAYSFQGSVFTDSQQNPSHPSLPLKALYL